MKMVPFVVIIMISGIFMGFSQSFGADSEIKKDETRVHELLSKIEQAQGFPNAMNRAIQLFERETRPGKVTPELKREIINRLVGVYKTMGAPSQLCADKFPDIDQYIQCLGKEDDLDELIKSANRRGIIGIVSNYGGSNEAREFFLDVLENANPLYRKEALHQIYFGGINGDEVYDKIQSLVSRGLVNKKDVLSALKGANPKRAIKEIQDLIATTKDPEQFVRKGNLLSEYGDPDLMDVVVDRYEHFKNIPQGERPHRYDPTYAFKRDVLEKYIEKKNGVRLKKALGIFADRGTFDDMSLGIIETKIKNGDAYSREAAADFLVSQIEKGFVSREKGVPVLKTALSRESDHSLKTKLEKAVSGSRMGGGMEK